MKNDLKVFWAGGFFYNPKTNSVFLHRRDGNTKFDPNMVSFFGGSSEKDEKPEDCFKRELFEETGLKIETDEIIPLVKLDGDDALGHRAREC